MIGEQAISHGVVRPMFFWGGQIRQIAILTDSKIVKANITPERFALLRDPAFTKLQYFATDRASYLGKYFKSGNTTLT